MAGTLSETELWKWNYSICAKQDTLSPWNTVVFKLIVAQLVERNTTSFVEPRFSQKTNQGHILEPPESSIKFALELA